MLGGNGHKLLIIPKPAKKKNLELRFVKLMQLFYQKIIIEHQVNSDPVPLSAFNFFYSGSKFVMHYSPGLSVNLVE